MKTPSKERGCDGKANVGSSYERAAEMLAHKHGKRYGVYRCPHCGGHHLTTKLDKRGEYAPLLYVTSNPSHHAEPSFGGDSVDGVVGIPNQEKP